MCIISPVTRLPFRTYYMSGILRLGPKQNYGRNAKNLQDFWRFGQIFLEAQFKFGLPINIDQKKV